MSFNPITILRKILINPNLTSQEVLQIKDYCEHLIRSPLNQDRAKEHS